MTQTELRILDAQIHEIIFGVKTREVRVRGSTETITIHSDNPCYTDGVFRREELIWAGPPEYTADIAMAWQVAEKLGFDFFVEKSGGRYFCSFLTGEDVTVDDWAETPDLAICLAALKVGTGGKSQE